MNGSRTPIPGAWVGRPRLTPLVAALLIVPAVTGAQDDSLVDLFENLAPDIPAPRPGPPAAGSGFDYRELNTLTLRIDGIASDHGKVVVLTYDEAQASRASDDTRAAGFGELSAARGSVETSFPALGDGPWTAFADHDANGDSQLNMKASRPLEGYGYTGAIDSYLPPTFDQAAIVTDAGTIRLVYLPQRRR